MKKCSYCGREYSDELEACPVDQTPFDGSRMAQICALKYIGTFLCGFFCAALLFIFVIMPKYDRGQFDYGFTNGVLQGRMDAVDAVQKEFGYYDGHSPYKFLFEIHTSDLISIETNGVKTIRVIP
jgi:hypothetical protein